MKSVDVKNKSRWYAEGGGRWVIQSLIHSILGKNIHNCDELSGTTHHVSPVIKLKLSNTELYQLLNVRFSTVEVSINYVFSRNIKTGERWWWRRNSIITERDSCGIFYLLTLSQSLVRTISRDKEEEAGSRLLLLLSLSQDKRRDQDISSSLFSL